MRYALPTMAALALAVLVPAADLSEPQLTPADVVALAAADLPSVPPAVRRFTRYLSLHNLPASERSTAAKVIAGHVHSLSREPDIVPPVTAAGGLLLRIQTDDYGDTFARTWEKLAGQEPYFHATVLVEKEVEEDRPYGYTQSDGSFRVTEHRRERVRKKVRQVALAPWLTDTPGRKKALETLVGETGSDVPVVTAEWFLAQTAVQFRRTPGYYDFLGVKDLASYERAIGFTKKDIDPGFLRELREAVSHSAVTNEDVLRRIVHQEKVGGDYWFTHDANQRLVKTVGKGNPVRNLGDAYEFQAVETYGHLPNGFWAMGLFDADGNRQDVAPDFIASDSTAPFSDRRVHVCLSCTRCHADGGLQPIEGWVRGVLNAPPNFLAATRPEDVKKLRQQYVRRLEPALEGGRKRYAAVLAEATDLKPPEYAAAFGRLWEAWAERPVTVERAARDLGCTPRQLQDALAAQGAAVDPILASFRLPRPRPIPVVSWYESYPAAQLALGGKSLPTPKER